MNQKQLRPSLAWNSQADTLKKVEVSEWLDWMRRELPAAGLDLPSEETSVLFAAKAICLAERVRSLSRHLPLGLREQLIQASLLHHCWLRQRKLRRDTQADFPQGKELLTCEATKFLGRWNGDSLIQATDGNQYVVNFPRSDADTALATKALCIELARLVGLPVPNSSVILVSSNLAREAGIVVGGWPRYMSKGGVFQCLGLRVGADVTSPENSWPDVNASKSGFRFLVGSLVFDLLVLNLLRESPAFHLVHRQKEPIFLYHSHCMMDASWTRFMKAGYKDLHGLLPSAAQKITSIQQLEFWTSRTRNVDLNCLWKLAFALPPVWYGEHRILLAAVLRKLEGRIGSQQAMVRHFVQNGFFPNIRIHPADEATRSAVGNA